MKQYLLKIGLPLAAAGIAGAYLWIFQSKKATPHEMTCLSAIVPSVVLHHEQEQIVHLLQTLADENNEAVPDELKHEAKTPVFSPRVDDELLNIARLFQIRGSDATMEKADVMSSAGRALAYFKTDAPSYMEGCLQRLIEAETDCGTVEKPSDTEKICLEKHSESIHRWAQKFLPVR